MRRNQLKDGFCFFLPYTLQPVQSRVGLRVDSVELDTHCLGLFSLISRLG